MNSLRVLSPGMHTTVQDEGRKGVQHLGIPAAGALDPVNLRLANLIVGNGGGEGAIEILMSAASFEVTAESLRIAVAGPGARLDLEAPERRTLPAYRSFILPRGFCFRVSCGASVSVCYLAVEGGFALPAFMGSQATYCRGAFGGLGRPLQVGDELPLNRTAASARPDLGLPAPDFPPRREFRILLGPQRDWFAPESIDGLLSEEFAVSHQSDRMGFRLTGFRLRHARGFNIISEGIAPGAIQVPGSGEPIVLLADRQTTGGYPKVGVVISADLPAFARLRPGDRLRFRAVEFEDARQALIAERARFAQLKAQIREMAPPQAIDAEALMAENLIGGVIDAKDPPTEADG